MKVRIIIFLGFLLLISTTVKSQQFPLYSQYWTNKFLLNPAVAGHEGYTAFNLTARKQWVKFQNSPGTVAITGQTRLVRSSHISRGRNVKRRRRNMSRGGKVGLGGYVFTDKAGVFSKIGFQGTYAYHLALRESQFSFGGSLVGLQYSLDKSQITTGEEDQLISGTASNGYVIDGNFGAYYSNRSLYAGFSAMNLFESFFKLNNRDGSKTKLEREYLFLGGYRYDVIDFVFLEPSFNLKISESAVAQLDLNLTTYFKEDYWAGLAYRSGSSSKIATETLGGRGSSIIIYGGARVDKFYFGYSFDYSLSSIQKHSIGSHEIMVAVKIGDNARRYRWLNRY